MQSTLACGNGQSMSVVASSSRCARDGVNVRSGGVCHEQGARGAERRGSAVTTLLVPPQVTALQNTQVRSVTSRDSSHHQNIARFPKQEP